VSPVAEAAAEAAVVVAVAAAVVALVVAVVVVVSARIVPVAIPTCVRLSPVVTGSPVLTTLLPAAAGVVRADVVALVAAVIGTRVMLALTCAS
jgi:hypothetical protein